MPRWPTSTRAPGRAAASPTSLHVVRCAARADLPRRLDAEGVGALIDSPARRKLAGELSAGARRPRSARSGGGRSERVLRSRAMPPPRLRRRRALGLVTVDRADPAERWLVRQLPGRGRPRGHRRIDGLRRLRPRACAAALRRRGVTAQGHGRPRSLHSRTVRLRAQVREPGPRSPRGAGTGRAPPAGDRFGCPAELRAFDFTATPDGDAPGRAGAVDRTLPSPRPRRRPSGRWWARRAGAPRRGMCPRPARHRRRPRPPRPV